MQASPLFRGSGTGHRFADDNRRAVGKIAARLASGLAVAACTVLLCASPAAGATTGVAVAPGEMESSWALAGLGAPRARPDGQGVRVAIVDSGIDASHPAFAGRIAGVADCLDAGADDGFCRTSGSPADHAIGADHNGHGTHVAGIVAGEAISGEGGVEGVAPGAELLVARSLRNTCDAGFPQDSSLADDTKGGSAPGCRAIGAVEDVVAGIRWATAEGANIINLSIDAGVELDWVEGGIAEAVADAWSRGIVVVASTGNRSATIDDDDLRSVPLVLVGALDRDGAVAAYSNVATTARWPMLAPGGDAGGTCPENGVASTFPMAIAAAGTGCLSGTSMAAAFVSGALASIMTEGVDGPSALAHLLATADPRDAAGRVDLGAALATPIAPAPSSFAAGLAGGDAAGGDVDQGTIFAASGTVLDEHPLRVRAAGLLMITIGIAVLGTRNRRPAAL